VRRLSYSALALFERCSYRYFAERVIGLAPRPRGHAADGSDGEFRLAATELGDAVHRLLELIPLGKPAPPARQDLDATVRDWYPDVTDAELDRICDMVDAYCTSDLASRIARLPGARPERPFAFEHDGVLLHGRLDVLWRDGEKALVVDYKSNALEGTDPASVVDTDIACSGSYTRSHVFEMVPRRPRSPTSSSSSQIESPPRRSLAATPRSSRQSSPL
jgi:hypothetical protein